MVASAAALAKSSANDRFAPDIFPARIIGRRHLSDPRASLARQDHVTS